MKLAVAKLSPERNVLSGSDIVPLEQLSYLHETSSDDALLVSGVNLYTDEGPWTWGGYCLSRVNGSFGPTERFEDFESLRRRVLDEQPTIMHTHTRGINLNALLRDLKRQGARLIHTTHGLDELTCGLIPSTWDQADLITTPSEFAAERIREAMPSISGKVRAFPNSTDLGDYIQDPEVLEKARQLRSRTSPNGEFVVATNGRLEPDKGIIETALAVTDLIGEGYPLAMTFAGMLFDPKHLEVLQEIFKDSGTESRFHHLGKIERTIVPKDMAAFYRASDLLVIPSDTRNETFCLSALEALALGTPAVVSNVGGTKEVYVDEGLAIGVRPRDRDSIRLAIKEVLHNLDRERERARRASEIIREKYHSRAVTRRLYRLYEKVEEDSPRTRRRTTSTRKGDLLVYGAWPDPRSSGISSVVHDVILGANQDKRNVYLVTESWDTKQTAGPKSIMFYRIPSDHSFDWKKAIETTQVYASFEDLTKADLEGRLTSDGTSLLRNVSILHSHSDDIIPHPDPEKAKDRNDYKVLADYISRVSGLRPALVRTRHDVPQAGFDRISRLSGLDWETLSDELKIQFIEHPEMIELYVEHNIETDGANLVEPNIPYGWDQQYLEEAMGHVGWALTQAHLWRTEADDFDAIVNLTEDGVRATKLLTAQPEENHGKFRAINNGSSFTPNDWGRVHGLIAEYHTTPNLKCYRGASTEKEGISFKPEDRKVVYVGRADRSKGVYELAQSLAMLYHRGCPIRGIFIGGDFDEETRRKLEAIDPTNARNYMLFTGGVSDVDVLASLYGFANVIAMPTHHDSCSLVGIEAGSMGKPIVTTNFSGTGEIYIRKPNETGTPIALPVRKPFASGSKRYSGVAVDSLTEQLERVITDDALAIQLSENAKTYSKHFTAERMGREYANLFDELERSRVANAA